MKTLHRDVIVVEGWKHEKQAMERVSEVEAERIELTINKIVMLYVKYEKGRRGWEEAADRNG